MKHMTPETATLSSVTWSSTGSGNGSPSTIVVGGFVISVI